MDMYIFKPVAFSTNIRKQKHYIKLLMSFEEINVGIIESWRWHILVLWVHKRVIHFVLEIVYIIYNMLFTHSYVIITKDMIMSQKYVIENNKSRQCVTKYI